LYCAQGERLKTGKTVLLIILVLIVSSHAKTDSLQTTPLDSFPIQKDVFHLKTYEPTRVGYSCADGEGVSLKNSCASNGFMDFFISIEYPFFEFYSDYLNASFNKKLHINSKIQLIPVPLITFSGRFAQYIATRRSSPVVSKSFNPKLLLRWGKPADNYRLEIGYAHESNGQSISDSLAYLRERANDSIQEHENGFPYFSMETDEKLSRGWDFFDANYRLFLHVYRSRFTLFGNYKYFFPVGIIQGSADNKRTWESMGLDIKRQEVDGLFFSVEYKQNVSWYILEFPRKWKRDTPTFGNPRLLLSARTGIKNSFDYNTLRTEVSFDILGFPISLFYQRGYLNDLSMYYHYGSTIGASFILR